MWNVYVLPSAEISHLSASIGTYLSTAPLLRKTSGSYTLKITSPLAVSYAHAGSSDSGSPIVASTSVLGFFAVVAPAACVAAEVAADLVAAAVACPVAAVVASVVAAAVGAVVAADAVLVGCVTTGGACVGAAVGGALHAATAIMVRMRAVTPTARFQLMFICFFSSLLADEAS